MLNFVLVLVNLFIGDCKFLGYSTDIGECFKCAIMVTGVEHSVLKTELMKYQVLR